MASDGEHAWDPALRAQLDAAGVRHRRLSREEHWEREREWRDVYGNAFRPNVRDRHGDRAVYEFLAQPARHWLMVPFLRNIPGIPMNVLSPRLSAFACEGPLLGLGEFNDVEFFVSPPDFAWTFVRTHEDFALGGPYFVRADWVEQSGGSPRTPDR